MLGNVEEEVVFGGRSVNNYGIIPLPSMILSDVLSLRSEIDELQANVNHLREFGEACIMAVTETWLTHMESDSLLEIDGFVHLYIVHLHLADAIIQSDLQ